MDNNVVEFPEDNYDTSEEYRAKRNGQTGLAYPYYLQLKEQKPESKFRIVRFFTKIVDLSCRWFDEFSENLLPRKNL